MLEAIENKDTKGIVEELGDVLLQIMLHAQILSETEAVSIDDVIQGLSDKMIRRHPHVFGDESADSAEEVKQNWEVLKANEKRGQKPTENIFNIPSDLPSLHYAQILQDRAVKQGFDWDDVSGVLDKIQEEAREVTEAESYEEKEDEIGDLIFTLVNLSRRLDVHADSALRSANIKFKLRFELMVKLATEDGLEFQDLPLEVQDKYWDKAKVILRS